MISQKIRPKVLSAVYKNQPEVISTVLNQISYDLAKEALEVCFMESNLECAQLLFPLLEHPDVEKLLNISLGCDTVDEQQKMVRFLLPFLSEGSCKTVVDRACCVGWGEVFLDLLDRFPLQQQYGLKLNWTVCQGDIEGVLAAFSLCDREQLNIALFLSVENSQWEVAKILIPLSDPDKIIPCFGFGYHHRDRIERFKHIIDEVECEQQNQRLASSVLSDHSQSKRKM